MPKSAHPKTQRHPLRSVYRFTLGAIALFILGVAFLLIWGNLVGIPGFVTSLVKQELRKKNLALDFSELRLKGIRRIVATDVRFSSTTASNAPTVQIGEAELLLNNQLLRRGDLDISGARILQADLDIPISPPGEAERRISITNAQMEVQFLPDDTFRLRSFSAEAFGAKATATGLLKSFSRLKAASKAKPGTPFPAWKRQLYELLPILDRLQFESQPSINVEFTGDAAALQYASASLEVRSEKGRGSWGKFDQLQLNSTIHADASNGVVRAHFSSELRGLRSPAVSLNTLSITAASHWTANMARLITNQIAIAATGMTGEWGQSSSVTGRLASSQPANGSPIHSEFFAIATNLKSGEFRSGSTSIRSSLAHSLPFPSPAVLLDKLSGKVPQSSDAIAPGLAGTWELEAHEIRSPDAAVESVRASGEIAKSSTNGLAESAQTIPHWRFVAPFQIPFRVDILSASAGELSIPSARATGHWEFPTLSVPTIHARINEGELSGSTILNVRSRQVSAEAVGSFDFHKAATLLTRPVQRWLAQFSWTNPPAVSASLQLQLPPWTNSWDRFQKDVLPSLQITGRFAGGGAFRGIPVDWASSEFKFSDYLWTLPELKLTRPEGGAILSFKGNIRDATFEARFDSRVNPAVLKPLFSREQQPAFEMLTFPTPPHITGSAVGSWLNQDQIGFAARVNTTNFFVKEQAFSDATGEFTFTNQVLEARNVIAHRGKEELRAPYLRLDFPAEVMFVTNAVSTIDPWVAMSLVGDEAYRAIDPYRFASTPSVRVNGLVPLRHASKADLRFEVAGHEFTYWKFHLSSLAGDVYWKGDHLSFSNIVAGFYKGQARWSGYFFINDQKSADFSFKGVTTNTDINLLVADLTGTTNHLEGTLDGELVITSANSADPESWDGYGQATLSDGFLWNVPIFGVFSPILDSILPGLGASRISSGAGTFSITNSVVYTRDMQVRAPAFRLNYNGRVNLEGELDAKVDAEILRDVWLVGRIFSFALWPVSKAFEARVSGTLSEPKTDLRYLPNPFRAISEAQKNARSGAVQAAGRDGGGSSR